MPRKPPRPDLVARYSDRFGMPAAAAGELAVLRLEDFFRPLPKPLRALPCAGDHLDLSIGVVDDLAAPNGVMVHRPMVWRRENTWA